MWLELGLGLITRDVLREVVWLRRESLGAIDLTWYAGNTQTRGQSDVRAAGMWTVLPTWICGVCIVEGEGGS